MEFKLKLNDTRIGGRKSDKQNSEIKNIRNLSDVWEKVIQFYKDYSTMMKNAATHGKGLKILISKQMLQKLPIALAQVKTGNTSENLLNAILII